VTSGVDFYEREAEKSQNSLWCIRPGSCFRRFVVLPARCDYARRFVDLALSLALLPYSSFYLLLTAIAVFLRDWTAPVLYSPEKNRACWVKNFRFYKFRSMRQGLAGKDARPAGLRRTIIRVTPCSGGAAYQKTPG